MVERGQGGHIVNVASARRVLAVDHVYPAYATTKAAVLMLTECLRAELAREGIGVTAVCPGFIDTDISRTTIHVGVDETAGRRAAARTQVASYAPPRLRARTRWPGSSSAPSRATSRSPSITPEAKLLPRDQPLHARPRPSHRQARPEQDLSEAR